jgi:hypothetical protein
MAEKEEIGYTIVYQHHKEIFEQPWHGFLTDPEKRAATHQAKRRLIQCPRLLA